MKVRLLGGGSLDLAPGAELGAGGEGRVFSLAAMPTSVAKIYHHPTPEREAKLRAMVRRPPADPGRERGRSSLCWPTDLLFERSNGAFQGFLMPRLGQSRAVFRLYNPGLRRRERPLTTWRDLHGVARDVAAVMDAVHQIGAVVGDINESNTVVDDALGVTLIDCDSFRIVDPDTRVVYRSPVAKPEYTSPELQGCSMAVVDQTREDDLFGLAVLLFQLVLEGTHPYEGVYHGPGDPEPYGARIAQGALPFLPSRQGPYRPKPLAVPFDVLHPALRSAFVRCFVDGHARPKERPSAATWASLLTTAAADLRPCKANAQHLYGHHLGACPWCQRATQLGGLDPFPSRAEIERAARAARSKPRAVARSKVARPKAAPLRIAARIAAPRPAAGVASRSVAAPPQRKFRIHKVIWASLAFLLVVTVASKWCSAYSSPSIIKKPLSEAARDMPQTPVHGGTASSRDGEGARTGRLAASEADAARVAPRRELPPDVYDELDELFPNGGRVAFLQGASVELEYEVLDDKGRTALMNAVRWNRPDDARRFIDGGAPLDATDKEGFTALMYAANDARLPLVELLLAAHANPSIRDRAGYSALLFAVMGGNPDVVRALLDAGADPNVGSDAGWTPLISAANHGETEAAELLVSRGANLETEDRNGCTALMAAAYSNRPATLVLLLLKGAKPDHTSSCGSPLEYAVKSGCADCVSLLEAAGATVDEP